MIRALVFDFDGLILDTETPLHLSWQEIYDEAGASVSPAWWASLLGTAADPQQAYEVLERHVGRPLDRQALRERRWKREQELLSKEDVLPGVRELIVVARGRGLRLAVASSSEREWVQGHLRRLGLRPYFEAVLCAEDVVRTKPSPDLYIAAIRALKVLPEEAIAFEDSARGAEAAQRAGLFTIVVPNRVTCHLSFPFADWRVDSLAAHSLDEYIARADRAGGTAT